MLPVVVAITHFMFLCIILVLIVKISVKGDLSGLTTKFLKSFFLAELQRIH